MRMKHSPLKRTSLKRLRQVSVSPDHQSERVSPFDRLLIRLAHASQLGLLALGVFGYFYTVLPVYQKAVLDEEIAKKTIELSQKSAELDQKTKEVEAMSTTARVAEQRLAASSRKVSELKRSVDIQYAELRLRLGQDFQLLGSRLCGIGSKVAASDFGSCLRTKVLPLVTFDPWSALDRSTIAGAINAVEPRAASGGTEIDSTFAQQRSALDEKSRQADLDCEKGTQSDNYKDRFKKIEIDYKCSTAKSNIHLERLKSDYRLSSVREALTHSLLDDIFKELVKSSP